MKDILAGFNAGVKMNTIELIHKSSYELTESERLEVFGYINMIKARFGRKKDSVQESALPQSQNTDSVQERLDFINNLANQATNIGFAIDMDDFEKSRQDRELDR